MRAGRQPGHSPCCHRLSSYTAGDGILAEFGSVVNAVECAIAIQRTMAERNAQVEQRRRMRFRIGVNQGDVTHDESPVYGDGVNVAARVCQKRNKLKGSSSLSM
jgi:class 3 adenylate cyclase